MSLPCTSAQEAEADRKTLIELRLRAEKGDAQAQLEMGQVFALGRFGLATNYAEAVKWVGLSAEQGKAQAQYTLALCYSDGEGVAKYEVEAYKWYLLAAGQGDNKAKRNVSPLELMLPQEQIAEGKRRAQVWLEQRKNPPTNQ
jgi:TPR repeat protein